MKKICSKFFLTVLTAAVMSLGACTADLSHWCDSQNWYQPANTFDEDKIDVLYLVSTEVVSATDKNGKECWQSQLTVADLNAIMGEISWVEKNMFDEGFNVVAPYYHQMTFNALTQLSGRDFKSTFRLVSKEVCDAFDYYMKNQNGGRPFIIAGFSQGSMMALEVLKHMTDEQYSRMIACYSLGYRITAEDLKHPHIKAAAGEGDTGVVISFNSAQTREAIWPLVSEGAAACINPLNWKTDSTPATFGFKGTTNTVHVDPETNVLLVNTDDPEYYYSYYDLAPFFLEAGVSKDNLHHWDLLFYPSQIHDNAIFRWQSM